MRYQLFGLTLALTLLCRSAQCQVDISPEAEGDRESGLFAGMLGGSRSRMLQ